MTDLFWNMQSLILWEEWRKNGMEMGGLECQKIALVISSLMFTWTPKLRCSVNGRNHCILICTHNQTKPSRLLLFLYLGLSIKNLSYEKWEMPVAISFIANPDRRTILQNKES